MLKKYILFFILGIQGFAFFSCSENKNQPENNLFPVKRIAVIPQPISSEHGKNNIALPTKIKISRDLAAIPLQFLEQTIAEIGTEFETTANDDAYIQIIKDLNLKSEEYRLIINEKSCTLHYSTQQGLLWGVHTLRQILLQHAVSEKGTKNIPIITISDVPKKEWRGFHIDLARHMFTIQHLKRLIDQLSFYKINKLQLHLTDDQGWRIEIKKYPPLTEIGAWRPYDRYDFELVEKAKTDKSFAIDPRFIRNINEYGGFYTQLEIKDLIEYAAERGIETIPEIDMPGHFTAAIRAYNDLSCTNQPGWQTDFSDPICAGKRYNYPMIKDIIKEVADLFPSKYFHIGGDEVDKTQWKSCPNCQALISSENLKGVDGLQNYFIKEMSDYTHSLGKEVMAWDDAFIPEAPQNLLYTYWRDWMKNTPYGPAQITQKGFDIIFMEWGRFYLSATPSDDHLKRLYTFNLAQDFPGVVNNKVKGYQACVWTERIPNEIKLGHHIFPTLQAFTEVAWGSSTSDWQSFASKLTWHLNYLEKQGFAVRHPTNQ